MNQYMLPHDDGKDFQLVKYGNIAIEQLITKMKMIGADMERFSEEVISLIMNPELVPKISK